MDRNAFNGPPGGVALPGWNPGTGKILQGSDRPNLAGFVLEESSASIRPRPYVHDPYGACSSSSAVENAMLFGEGDVSADAESRPSEAFRRQNERWGLRTPDRLASVDEHDERQVALPPTGSLQEQLRGPVNPQDPQSACAVPSGQGRLAPVRAAAEEARPRHACPVSGCASGFSATQSLVTHIENVHLSAPNGADLIPNTFLQAYQRWMCHGLLIPWGKACRHCQAPGPRIKRRRPQQGALAPTSEPMAPCNVNEFPSTLVPESLLLRTPALLESKQGTLKHIPVACRALWSEALSTALTLLRERKDMQAAWLVVTLPRLVLGAVSRGGRKHNRQVTNIVMGRLRRWFLRQYESLFSEACSHSVAHRSRKTGNREIVEDLPEGTRRAVTTAVREGALSKAAKLLLENASPAGDVEAELRKLHPVRTVPVQIPNANLESNAELEIDKDVVSKALRTFPPGSSGGPSGLRPIHLIEALKKDQGGSLLEALALYCQSFVQGSLPLEARDWFCGARLIPISKKPSGVRPIAVGETLRRLAAKTLVLVAQDDAAKKLFPLLLGVNVAQGTEAIIHAVRAFAERASPGEAVVLVDFQNAYNTLDRQVMLDSIAVDAPAFAPYAFLLLWDTDSFAWPRLQDGILRGNSTGGCLRTLVLLPCSQPPDEGSLSRRGACTTLTAFSGRRHYAWIPHKAGISLSEAVQLLTPHWAQREPAEMSGMGARLDQAWTCVILHPSGSMESRP